MTTLFSPPHPKAKPYDPYEPQYVRTYTGLKAFGTLCVLGIGVYVLLQAFLYLSAPASASERRISTEETLRFVMQKYVKGHIWRPETANFVGRVRLIADGEAYRATSIVDSMNRSGMTVREIFECRVTPGSVKIILDDCHITSQRVLGRGSASFRE